MHKTRFVLVLLVATTLAFAAAPVAEAAPPAVPGDIGNDGGCGYFHYHEGNIKRGELPSYHYHHCM